MEIHHGRPSIFLSERLVDKSSFQVTHFALLDGQTTEDRTAGSQTLVIPVEGSLMLAAGTHREQLVPGDIAYLSKGEVYMMHAKEKSRIMVVDSKE